LPVLAVNGVRRGPCLWLSAALHGDEVNGIEIIREVLEAIRPGTLRGAVLAVPVVNVFGFIQQSRYLPDRRDLNRCFPGSPRGSLASRLAHLFVTEILGHCTHGIDLHTASRDNINLPQIRANLDDPETQRMARAFGASIMIDSPLRKGSLRETACRRGIPNLLYEAGSAQRFEKKAIQAGVRGVLNVMRTLGMLAGRDARKPPESRRARSSRWVRAPRGGLMRLLVQVGDRVQAREIVGHIADPFGESPVSVKAPMAGVVIGRTKNPVIHQGDAVIHIADLEGD
jgi:predicted deacylase